MGKIKKQRKKLNPFDVVVVLLLVCLVATFGYRIFMGLNEDNPNNNIAKYVVDFECTDEYDSLLSYLKKGDPVYFADQTLLGFLYAEQDNDKPVRVLSQNTNYIAVPDPYLDANETVVPKPYNKVTLGGKLSLNTEAVRVRDGDYYSIGGKNLTVGSTITVYTDTANFTLVVTNIAAVE